MRDARVVPRTSLDSLEEPILKPRKKIRLTDFIFRMIAMSKTIPNYIESFDYQKLKLNNADLAGLKLPGADLAGLDFSGSDLREADFENANLENANFGQTDIRGTNLKHAVVKGASFEDARIARTVLRGTPQTLSEKDVRAVIKKYDFFSKTLDYTTKWANESGSFENEFVDNGDGTVLDRETGLMWQQAGSENDMNYAGANAYADQINEERFAGFSDWRLPTIEELASLLENQRSSNGLYIDPVFDHNQKWCWSSDKRSGGGVWLVGFDYGDVYWDFEDFDIYVRLVRRGQ